MTRAQLDSARRVAYHRTLVDHLQAEVDEAQRGLDAAVEELKELMG